MPHCSGRQKSCHRVVGRQKSIHPTRPMNCINILLYLRMNPKMIPNNRCSPTDDKQWRENFLSCCPINCMRLFQSLMGTGQTSKLNITILSVSFFTSFFLFKDIKIILEKMGCFHFYFDFDNETRTKAWPGVIYDLSRRNFKSLNQFPCENRIVKYFIVMRLTFLFETTMWLTLFQAELIFK